VALRVAASVARYSCRMESYLTRTLESLTPARN
jgi:hypothetical protein